MNFDVIDNISTPYAIGSLSNCVLILIVVFQIKKFQI